MYLLDTNILSYWMRGDAAVMRRIAAHPPAALSLSAITLAEILYGIARSPGRRTERRRKLDGITALLQLHPFDASAAAAYADIRTQLERAGKPISERDTQIAAVALARGLTVVTHNGSEFRRIEGLRVEDWAAAT